MRMRDYTANRALLALITAVGCSDAPSELGALTGTLEGSMHCDPSSGLCFRVDARGTSCASSTWVAPVEDDGCPSGFEASGGRFDLLPGPFTTPEGSDALCRYGWARPALERSAADGHAGAIDTARLEPDCEVVTPTAGSALDLSWRELQLAFDHQTERVDPLPAGSAPKTPVRVEIIDSAVTRRAPDGEPSDGRLEHGRAMGLIVRRLACPSGGASCRAEVASTLALPLVQTTTGVVRDPLRGGTHGSLTDLASAIDDAVTAWRTTAPAHRLVLNLSVGWEPAYGGDYVRDPRELAVPVRAVWSAIARARCAGALVVAATGNRPEGPDAPSGPIYPAAWTTKPAPSAATCRALGVRSGVPASGEPFVFAVGGVESNDADLSIARRGSRPRVVAPSTHVVVADGGHHSALHTGTSVAAAVTSAAAAVVWSYRPDLGASEVMSLVARGGADIGRGVELCGSGAPCRGGARRVSICGALQAACSAPSAGCPSSLPACTRRPGGRIQRPRAVSPGLLAPAASASARGLSAVGAVGWPCGGDLFAGAPVTNPCPASQFPAPPATGVVGPYAEAEPICPHCALNPIAHQLYIEIDPLRTGTYTNPVLRVTVDASVGDVRYFDLSSSVPVLYAGSTAMVDDVDIGSPFFESATIEFVVNGNYSEMSPVLLWE
jgi:hypothetical protein